MCLLPVLPVMAVAQVPVITSVTPGSGKVGSTVTIHGSNFSSVASENFVYFGGGKAQVLSATSGSLKVLVPSTATYRPVSVMTGGFTAFSPRPFDLTFNHVTPVTDTSFAPMTQFDIDVGLQSSLMGDFDGDGKLDLVTIAFSTNQITIFPNTSTPGTISFGPGITIPTTTNLNEIALGDIDGDGMLDIIVANYQSVEDADSTASVYRNTSSPGEISFGTPASFFVGFFPTCVAVDDIDGDGKTDVVAVSFGDAMVSVLRNTSSPGVVSFDDASTFDTGGGTPHTIALGDLDGDNLPEMAVTNADLEEVEIFRNESSAGAISFADPELFQYSADDGETHIQPLFIAFGDMDGDGSLDLLVGDYGSNIFAARNAHPGTGTIAFDEPALFVKGEGLGAASLCDVNGDGRPDIVVGNSGDNTISVFENVGSPGSITNSSFASHIDFSASEYPIRIAAGDLDGDGHPELAAPSFYDGSVSIHRNLVPDGYVRAGIKAILQGPYDAVSDSMSTALASTGILEAHFGAGKVPRLAVDSINIELRNDSTAAGSTIRRFAAAWLMKDGTIRNFNDTVLTYVEYDTLMSGSFYVVIHHRNHLGVMTRNPVDLAVATSIFDFTVSLSQTYGLDAMVSVGSKFAVPAGDANGSGIVTAADANEVFSNLNELGYQEEDINLTGIVTAADANIVFRNLNAATRVP
jgi:hypothetical protein